MTHFSPEPPRKDLLVHHTYENVEIDRVLDYSPQAIDGQVVGSVSFGHTGVVGNAARLVDQDSDINITDLSSFMPLDEMHVSTWGKSEHPVDSTALNVFAVVTVDGTDHNLSHSTSEPTDQWQFAALDYDGEQIRLWYAQKDEDHPRIVDTVDVTGSVDSFELTFYTDGYGFVDDTRVYRRSWGEDTVDDIYRIGAEHNSITALGDAWDNDGIPFRGNNIRLAGALGEEKDFVLRQLDAINEARHIDTAAGKQLDRLAQIAGIRRKENESDARLRARIQATLAAGRSHGTFGDIIEATATILDTTIDRIDVRANYVSDPGTAFVYIRSSDIDDSDLTTTDITSILQDVVMAGHRVEVIEQGATPFELTDDQSANEPEKGLTSDSISTGGGLASDV